MLRTLAETAARLVFPPACEACQRPLEQEGLCDPCMSGIRFLKPPFCIGCGRTVLAKDLACAQCALQSRGFDRAYACAVYEGTIKDALHTFKFRGRKQLAHFFSDMMLSFLRTHADLSGSTCVAAVPMERFKKAQRGFNHSELLAKKVAQGLRLPDHSDLLRRAHSQEDQHRLGKRAREQNVREAFGAARSDAFRGHHVLLIDDVMTTGETCSACARALKLAGALSVTALVCARGA